MPKAVLVAVLKEKKDLNILLRERWYRIPAFYAPKKKFDYIAFYQPSTFKGSKSLIRYYARPKMFKTMKRRELFPSEFDHPDANEDYYRIDFKKIHKLKNPVKNSNRMRVSFGFTTLGRLKKEREVTGLFDVVPLENVMGLELKKAGIKASKEHAFTMNDGKRYRLDFAVFCKKGPLNIECDSHKWHSIKTQRIKDKIRDKALKGEGWSILRLKEAEITGNIGKCVDKVRKAVKKLGKIP